MAPYHCGVNSAADAVAGQTVYRGQTTGNVDVWRGIRYATPPTGDLRWRRARPLEPTSGTVDATTFGSVAPQQVNPGVPLSPDAVKSEDCLFLNVWAPQGAAGDGRRLPVMVWIHGGAYVFGAGTQPIYDGAHLASTQNIVVVTLNYRLGALGFADLGAPGPGTAGAAGPTASAGGRYESNAGLSDVLTALRWVADTIDAFGGDPDNVTVAGESAGGGMVTTLLTMPLARGLFHRAVAQSSPVTSVYDRARARFVVERLTAAVGGTCGDIESFAALDTDKLVAATMKAFTGVPAAHPGTIPFSPVVDGDLVPRHPIDVYRDGESLPIPLLIGTNRDEAALFKFMKSPLLPISEPAIVQMFTAIASEYPEVSIPTAERVAAAYPGAKAKSMGLDVARDMAFRMPTVWAAEGHAGVAPVHLYRFDWSTRLLRAIGIRASHATEVPYLFGYFPSGKAGFQFWLGGRRVGERIAADMQARWGSFIRDGDPNSRLDSATPSWPTFTTDRRATLVIDAHDSVVDDLDGPLREAWGDEVLGFR